MFVGSGCLDNGPVRGCRAGFGQIRVLASPAVIPVVFSPGPTRIRGMAKPYFVWLGSGRSKRRRVDGPAHWLDETAKARLPVPPGAILLDEFYQFCLEHDLVRTSGQALFITDAELLHNTLFYSIHLPRFDELVTLQPTRLAATLADAAAYPEFDSADPQAFAAALARAWSNGAQDPAARQDVYLLEKLPATRYGQALTASDSSTDVAWAGANDSDSLPITLPRLGRWQRPDDDTPAYLGRLQQLLRGLRRTLDSAGWTVSWADDGEICWLTGIYAQDAAPADQPTPDDNDDDEV